MPSLVVAPSALNGLRRASETSDGPVGTPRHPQKAVKWSSGLRVPSLAQKLHDLHKKLSRKVAVEKPEKSVESRKVVLGPSEGRAKNDGE